MTGPGTVFTGANGSTGSMRVYRGCPIRIFLRKVNTSFGDVLDVLLAYNFFVPIIINFKYYRYIKIMDWVYSELNQSK